MNEQEIVLGRVRDLYNLILKEQHEIMKQVPPGDLRINFYFLPGNVLISFFYQLAAFDATICKASWWKDSWRKDNLSDEDMTNIRDLEVFARHSLLIFFLSRIETNFKKIINLITPDFDPKNNRSFYDIYCELLNRLDLKDYIILFDVVRLARNTIHSNGVFISASGSNVSKTWAGKLYNFKHLTIVDFLTIEEILHLFNELFLVTKKITSHAIIASIPYVENKFN